MPVKPLLSGKQLVALIGTGTVLVIWMLRESSKGNGWSSLGSIDTCQNCGRVKEMKVACPICDYH